MIYSMTGFGQADRTFKTKNIKTEIRTLNSKSIDISLKIPSAYREKESLLRNLLSNALRRGKIDLTVTMESEDEEVKLIINTPLLIRYFKEIKKVANSLDLVISNEFLPDLLRVPEILKQQPEEPDPDEWKAIEESVKEAIKQVQSFRSSEGKHLYEDIRARENMLRELIDDIKPHEEARIQAIRNRIKKSLNDISEDIKFDQNRFEQEIIFYLEKLDITEEKVRLEKHLAYFDETLCGEEPGGKKLGFIAQELGREINTIGSKANDAEIQKIVVTMKDELEKIKEQLMNVL